MSVTTDCIDPQAASVGALKTLRHAVREPAQLAST
jgi:hypothetical protein